MAARCYIRTRYSDCGTLRVKICPTGRYDSQGKELVRGSVNGKRFKSELHLSPMASTSSKKGRTHAFDDFVSFFEAYGCKTKRPKDW